MAATRRTWARRLAWLVALWMAGVAAVFVVASVLKLVMRGVGLA
ncbi:MAG: DUF2474 family protein [Pigmentiphaga sp.]|nr:DUF2474 family protein [Pigmentiphaga sp.]MDX3905755.1 DUF2474 family protein [Pigmentiphaga sp.]